ncbi:MAG: hypothetical protein V5A36_02015 [Natronomonas sp.]
MSSIRPESAFESGAIDRDVVVVCKMGVVAKRATSVLRGEGYDAATLQAPVARLAAPVAHAVAL